MSSIATKKIDQVDVNGTKQPLQIGRNGEITVGANGNIVMPSNTSIGNVTSTEIGYLDGVTSGIQSQLNSKINSVGSQVVKQVVVWNPGINVFLSSASFVDLATKSFTFTAGNKIVVTGSLRYRGSSDGGGGWRLAYGALYVDNIGYTFKSSYNGIQNSEAINTINFAHTFVAVGGTTTLRIQGATYNGSSKSFGANDQYAGTTDDCFTFIEIGA